jgi:hypothetical protein
VEHLLLLMFFSATALGFIAAIVAGAGWLARRGHGVVAQIVVLNYLVFSIPIFLAQIAVVFDLMLFFIGMASIVVPALRGLADRGRAGPVTRVVAGMLTTVSLFSSVSTWALSLVAAPATVVDLVRMKYRTEAAVMAAVLQRVIRKRV